MNPTPAMSPPTTPSPAICQFTLTYTSETSKIIEVPENLTTKHVTGIERDRYIFLKGSNNEQPEHCAILRGRYVISGWKKFAAAQNFEFGDVVLFQHKGNWRFKVEKQEIINLDAVEEEETNPEDNSGDNARLVSINITKDKIMNSRMYLPQCFVDANDLKMLDGQTIYMVSDNGDKWPVKVQMQFKGTRERMQLRSGLKEFLEAQNIMPNDIIELELLTEEDSTPMLHLLSKVTPSP